MKTSRHRYAAVYAALLSLAAGACAIDLGGNLLPDVGSDDGASDLPGEPDDWVADDWAADDGAADDREESPHDAFIDAEIVRPEEPAGEDIADIAEADEEEPAPPCEGKPVGGFCWYASEPNGSCTAACAGHGGCNIEGTRDYAGSGGTDEGCIRVLDALGFGEWQHFSESNNDLGCQFAWRIYTYWSTYLETTCEAFPIIGEHDPHVIRMCACEH